MQGTAGASSSTRNQSICVKHRIFWHSRWGLETAGTSPLIPAAFSHRTPARESAPTGVRDGAGRSGTGGNVHITAKSLELQNSASIVTSTAAIKPDGTQDSANVTDVTGRAGNIDIKASTIRLRGGSADNPSGISAANDAPHPRQRRRGRHSPPRDAYQHSWRSADQR